MLGYELLHSIALQPGDWTVIVNPNSLSGARIMEGSAR
jgi:hypothetical protein